MKRRKEDLDLLEKFYREEIESYSRNTRHIKNKEFALKNVGQALFWGTAILEFYQNDKSTFEELERHEKNIITGFRYARNRLAHQFMQLLYISDGAEFPMKLPAPFFEIRWRPFDELSKPDRKHQNEKQIKAYKTSLEDKPVRFTFEALDLFFTHARSKITLT